MKSETGVSGPRRSHPPRSGRQGYHNAGFGVYEWRMWREAASVMGLSVSELTRLVGRNLPALLPYLKLIPPKK